MWSRVRESLDKSSVNPNSNIASANGMIQSWCGFTELSKQWLFLYKTKSRTVLVTKSIISDRPHKRIIIAVCDIVSYRFKNIKLCSY